MTGMGRKRSLAQLLNERPLMGVDYAARNDRDGRISVAWAQLRLVQIKLRLGQT
jgi:hypothetical protein